VDTCKKTADKQRDIDPQDHWGTQFSSSLRPRRGNCVMLSNVLEFVLNTELVTQKNQTAAFIWFETDNRVRMVYKDKGYRKRKRTKFNRLISKTKFHRLERSGNFQLLTNPAMINSEEKELRGFSSFAFMPHSFSRWYIYLQTSTLPHGLINS